MNLKSNQNLKIEVRRYLRDDYQSWNRFIKYAKNATFLFNRKFMDYHKDRFDDYSLMVYKADVLIALWPANISGSNLHSHQGLTYGGLILNSTTSLIDIELIFDSILLFLREKEIDKLILKSFLNLYASQPNEELEYIINKRGAKIIHQNLVLAINFQSDYTIYKSKLKRYRKLKSGKFQIKEGSTEFEPFWNNLLEPRLAEKYNTKPVHTLSEMLRLQKAFSNHIHQFNIYEDDELLAGITIFKTKMAVKSQYGMASAKGEKLGALDMLFVYLIKMFQTEGARYFSMGRINDDGFELGYNTGMLKQKQEFGCEIHLQPVYELELND